MNAVEQETPGAVIALRSPQSVAILRTEEINDLWRLAEGLARAQGFLPVAYAGKPGNVFAAIMTGRDLGLGPMVALREIHIIDGKPGLSANLMLGKVRESGQVTIVESGVTDEKAWIKAERNGEISLTEWTYAEAERISRNGKKLVDGDNWRNYRRDMLWARCVGRFVRRHCSDLLLGLNYSAEEMRDIRDLDGPHLTRGADIESVADEIPEDDGGEGAVADPPPFDLAKYAELDAATIKQMLPVMAQRPDGKELLEAVLAFEQNGAAPGGKNRSTIVTLINKLLDDLTGTPAEPPVEPTAEAGAALPAEEPEHTVEAKEEAVAETAPSPTSVFAAPKFDSEPQLEVEVDEIMVALVKRIEAGCALIQSEHPDLPSWTPEGLIEIANRARVNPTKPVWHRHDIDADYEQLSDLSVEQLSKLWQSFPDDVRAAVEAEAGDA